MNNDCILSEKQQIVKRVESFIEKFNDYKVDFTKEDKLIKIHAYCVEQNQFAELIINAIFDCVDCKNAEYANHDIKEIFTRWLDIDISKSSVNSLKNSLMLCGVDSYQNDINAQKEDLIEALIKHGMSQHLKNNQISIIHNKTPIISDIEQDEEGIKSDIKVVFGSTVIGRGAITTYKNSIDKNNAYFCIDTETLATISSNIH